MKLFHLHTWTSQIVGLSVDLTEWVVRWCYTVRKWELKTLTRHKQQPENNNLIGLWIDAPDLLFSLDPSQLLCARDRFALVENYSRTLIPSSRISLDIKQFSANWNCVLAALVDVKTVNEKYNRRECEEWKMIFHMPASKQEEKNEKFASITSPAGAVSEHNCKIYWITFISRSPNISSSSCCRVARVCWFLPLHRVLSCHRIF